MDSDRIAIAYVQSAADAREALAAGYEPVECSFGDDSVIGPLQMDHHGAYSHLPGVAIRAHGDLFGARAHDPRFVVTGNPDADAVGAILGLAGMLQLQPREADVINANDIDPVAVGDLLEQGDAGLRLLSFQAACRASGTNLYSAEGFRVALGLFIHAFTEPLTPARVEQITAAERTRVARGNEGFRSAGLVGLACSPAWAFDVWYRTCPIVVAWVAKTSRISIGASNDAVAAELCRAPEGLLAMVSHPDFIARFGEGWGGRPTIVGSPRGSSMTREQAKQVWNWLQGHVGTQ